MFALIVTAIVFAVFGVVAGMLIARTADDSRIRDSVDASTAAATVAGFRHGCWYVLSGPDDDRDNWMHDLYHDALKWARVSPGESEELIDRFYEINHGPEYEEEASRWISC